MYHKNGNLNDETDSKPPQGPEEVCILITAIINVLSIIIVNFRVVISWLSFIFTNHQIGVSWQIPMSAMGYGGKAYNEGA